VTEDRESSPDAAELSPLRIAGSWIQALTDGSKEVIALLDEDGSVQYLSVSGAVQDMLGYDALDIMSMSPAELLHPLDVRRVLDGFGAVATHPGGRITLEYRGRHRDGHFVRLESTAVNRLRNEYVAAIVVHTREVVVGEPMDAVPSSAAPPADIDDEETLVLAIEESIERATSDDYGFSVLVLELERSETLHEAYGEEVASGVMNEVGRRLDSLLRPGDRLARLEGERFAVLLDGVGDRTLANRIAARVQRTVGNKFSARGQDVLSAAIVGIVTSERRYERADDVLRDAVVAVARAKGDDAPEGRMVYRTGFQVAKTRHMSLMAELHNALSRNELRVHYMPIVSLATRTVTGFEALARWHHPERGIISPDLFIPIAEETGQIVRLGRWVMLEACRQMVDWQKRYNLEPPLTLSVNLSAKQFAEFDLDAQVETILQDTGFDPGLLTLEVSERALFEFREAVTETVRRLKKHGVMFSLDNFGTGPSSVTSLHALPYDRLKVDRSLVGKMQDDEEARELVKAIISLAHNLSLEVVGLGVETPGHAAQLSQLWCEYAQGYLFGKPMEANAAGGLIASFPRWWS
jgi:diguanylate cyclase (GGDEF)-like protein/PAS domain S-box-containing protein